MEFQKLKQETKCLMEIRLEEIFDSFPLLSFIFLQLGQACCRGRFVRYFIQRYAETGVVASIAEMTAFFTVLHGEMEIFVRRVKNEVRRAMFVRLQALGGHVEVFEQGTSIISSQFSSFEEVADIVEGRKNLRFCIIVPVSAIVSPKQKRGRRRGVTWTFDDYEATNFSRSRFGKHCMYPRDPDEDDVTPRVLFGSKEVGGKEEVVTPDQTGYLCYIVQEVGEGEKLDLFDWTVNHALITYTYKTLYDLYVAPETYHDIVHKVVAPSVNVGFKGSFETWLRKGFQAKALSLVSLWKDGYRPHYNPGFLPMMEEVARSEKEASSLAQAQSNLLTGAALACASGTLPPLTPLVAQSQLNPLGISSDPAGLIIQ